MTPTESPPIAATLPAFTVADVMRWGPRCDEARVRELFAGRERLTALDALDLPIPAEDRIWAVTREGALPWPLPHEWACREAEAALAIAEARGETIDPRSRAAIAAKRAWLRGEVGHAGLAAARDAAAEVAREVAREVDRAARAAIAAASPDADVARIAAMDGAGTAGGEPSVDRLRALLAE